MSIDLGSLTIIREPFVLLFGIFKKNIEY